jgi:hypothetical protein
MATQAAAGGAPGRAWSPYGAYPPATPLAACAAANEAGVDRDGPCPSPELEPNAATRNQSANPSGVPTRRKPFKEKPAPPRP